MRISLPDHGLDTTTDRLGRFRLQIPVGAGTMATYVAQYPGHRSYEDYAAAGTFGLKFKLERKEP